MTSLKSFIQHRFHFQFVHTPNKMNKVIDIFLNDILINFNIRPSKIDVGNRRP